MARAGHCVGRCAATSQGRICTFLTSDECREQSRRSLAGSGVGGLWRGQEEPYVTGDARGAGPSRAGAVCASERYYRGGHLGPPTHPHPPTHPLRAFFFARFFSPRARVLRTHSPYSVLRVALSHAVHHVGRGSSSSRHRGDGSPARPRSRRGCERITQHQGPLPQTEIWSSTPPLRHALVTYPPLPSPN